MSARRRRVLHRRIAPRLASGESRIPSGNAMPPLLKFALRVLATQEGRSLSWLIETLLIDAARRDERLSALLDAHALEYVPRKSPEPDVDHVSMKEAIRLVARKVGK